MALFSHGEDRLDPELWENSGATRVSVHRVNEKEQTEDSSYPKGIEVLLREVARKSYPDPENVDNPMITPWDYEVRQSVRVLVLQNKDCWIRPTDLSWRFPILVTICEFLFINLSWKVHCEFGSQGLSQQAKHSEKQNSQIKHTGIRLGSRIPVGNEILYIDFLGKVIHGDENNVCLSRTTTFHHCLHLPFWWWTCETAFTRCCFTSTTFCLSLLWRFVNDFGSRLRWIAQRSFCVVCQVTIGRFWNCPCFRSSYSLAIVSKSVLVPCFWLCASSFPRHKRVAHTEHVTSTVWIVMFCVNCDQN